MSKEILELKPANVWKNFYALTQIPRPSKKEAKVIAFAKEFGEKLGLETLVDEVGNVLIRKPATKGMENRKAVVLQSHLDMVPQKNSDTKHDFETDPIDAYIDGDWVTARGTTLGADNGIGVAAILSVLESTDIAHPALEAFFTIDEETGMTGAFNLKPDWLKGELLMNLDSEDEGELYIGCAGGINTTAEIPFFMHPAPINHKALKISITGLKGGHSGLDIALGRGNSIKLMTQILYTLEWMEFKLASFDGGSLRNAIPREAFATITVAEDKVEQTIALVNYNFAIIKEELKATESGIKIEVEEARLPQNVIDSKSTYQFIRALYAFPDGVIRMSDYMPIPETSTNLAVAKSENDKFVIKSLQRSFVDTAKNTLTTQIRSVFELFGATAKHDGAYPGWNPNPGSEMVANMKKVYETSFGKTPEIKSIHAGLECGLFSGIYPEMDMVSFGPTIRFPHSPDEKVKIDTVEKFWKFLVDSLKNVPMKS